MTKISLGHGETEHAQLPVELTKERGLRLGSRRARESMVFGRDRHENSFLIYVNVNADKHSPACGKIPYDLTSSEVDCNVWRVLFKPYHASMNGFLTLTPASPSYIGQSISDSRAVTSCA